MLRRLAAAAVLVLLTACMTDGGAPAAKTSVKEDMAKVVQPAADTLFAIVSKVDPNFDPKPIGSAEWKKALDAAKAMKASADFLLQPENMKDQDAWKTAATQMQTLSAAAVAGAQAKDGKAFSSAANDLGDNCTACHSKYKNQRAS